MSVKEVMIIDTKCEGVKSLKFNLRLNYKELQIVKHALQHYVKRPNSTDKEVREENRLLTKVTNTIVEIKNEYNIKSANERANSNMRNKFGKHKDHYEWDLAVEWFQTSNDTFFEKYGFNFVPRGKLFDEAKEYVFLKGSKNIQNNITVRIEQPSISHDEIIKGINQSVYKNMFNNMR